MVKGIGIDIVKMERIGKAIQRWSDRFERKILTAREMEYGGLRKEKITYLAGRFAAKEAVCKSLGIAIGWQYIEVLSERNGRPLINFRKRAKKVILERGVKKVLITLSHDGDYAIAQALAIGD